MKKIVLLALLCCQFTFSQEYEIGALTNLERTTFISPDNSYIRISNSGSGPGTKSEGYDTNLSVGMYFSYFYEIDEVFSAELFVTKTSAANLEDFSYTSINFIPYYSFNPFESYFDLGNFLVTIGGGVAYMLKSPNLYLDTTKERKFDIPMKLGISYRYKNKFNIEIGTHTSFTEIHKDKIQRGAHYLGIKIPLLKYD